MGKIAEPKAQASTANAPLENLPSQEAASRFRCLSVAQTKTIEDDEAFKDDEGFQCPCCLPR